MRTVKIEYKELDVSVSFEDSDRIGKIQEEILRICSLIIYNIEYTKIYFSDETEYILGSEEMKFMDKFSDFLEAIGKGVEGGEGVEIINFEVIERKRDENGNVVKENMVIDRFNQYLLEVENERFIESLQVQNNPLNSLNLTLDDIEMDDLGGISSLLNQIPIFNINSAMQPLNIVQHITEISTNRNRNNSLNNEIDEVDEEEKVNEVEGEEIQPSQEQNQRVNHEINMLMTTVNEYVDRRRNTTWRMTGLFNRRNPLIQQIQNEINTANLRFGDRIQDVDDVEEEEMKEDVVETVSTPSDSDLDSDDEEEQTLNGSIPLTRTGEIPLYRTVLRNLRRGNPNPFAGSGMSQSEMAIRFPISQYNQDILNDPTNLNLLSGLMTSVFGRGRFEVVGEDLNGNIHNMGNLGNLNNFGFTFGSDVKVVITEEEFEDELEHHKYSEISRDAKITKCSICTEDFVENDDVIKTKCDHIFHRDCIKPWLCNESVKCPICREEIIEGKPKI